MCTSFPREEGKDELASITSSAESEESLDNTDVIRDGKAVLQEDNELSDETINDSGQELEDNDDMHDNDIDNNAVVTQLSDNNSESTKHNQDDREDNDKSAKDDDVAYEENSVKSVNVGERQEQVDNEQEPDPVPKKRYNWRERKNAIFSHCFSHQMDKTQHTKTYGVNLV